MKQLTAKQRLLNARAGVSAAYKAMNGGSTRIGFRIGKVLTSIDDMLDGNVPYDFERLKQEMESIKQALQKKRSSGG